LPRRVYRILEHAADGLPVMLGLLSFNAYFVMDFSEGKTVPPLGRAGRGGFMRRFLTLVCLLVLAVPAGISISGCVRNPDAKYCNGLGNGTRVTDLYAITLGPQYTGISLAYGQTRQSSAPAGVTCKGTTVSVSSWSYGTFNDRLVDVSPGGNLCAGTWNRNTGGGIADYTICSAPNPLPDTGGLPYAVTYITAGAEGVTSNAVPVYVHTNVTSISLVGPSTCTSQSQIAQLDAQACYAGAGNAQYEFCAPATLTTAQYSCPLAPGVSSVPTCENSIGTMSYSLGTSLVGTINPETNQVTAQLPGTTVITASIAGSGSSAGYFSTCPPASISVTLNGADSGTVTQGVTQNLVTSIYDTNNQPITGLTLDYQSTNPQNIAVSSTGAISANFPGAATVFAICQPYTCNPAPINEVGVQGTGLSISSNPVDITVPGTASAFMWFAAPGQSQYFVPYELLTGTPGSTVRLPYVPNSMVMDKTGINLYFGSQTELMVYSTTSNSLTNAFPNLPGVVLGVAPNDSSVVVNDQVRRVFYITNGTGTVLANFTGMGSSASWTPDSKTLYISDSAAANNLPANVAAGIAGHTDTLYVYNANTGWTTYPLPCSTATGPTATNPCVPSGNVSAGAQSVAVTVPGVGAYESGNPTVAHTWCPTGTPTNQSSMSFYPQGDSVDAETEILAATADGQHILGASASGGAISFTDIGLNIPAGPCPDESSAGVLQPLLLTHTLNQTTMSASAAAVNQIVTSPAAVVTGNLGSAYSLSFVTYTGSTTGATLPWYKQTIGNTSSLGTVGYVTLTGASSITAPIAGAFSPDNSLFFVSTTGDNKVHYINATTLTDTQQVTPNLPACTPISAGGTDAGCTYTGTGTTVPTTVITVKPRATT
jgi:trimeric autotransporter adhesin